MRLANTLQLNQWPAIDFWRQVDTNEQQEVRVLAAYDKPIDRKVIRDQVIAAILAYAIPAGNA